MTLAYTSKLTLEQYELFESLLLAKSNWGRSRTVNLMSILQAILYVLVKGFVLLPKRWTVARTYGWLHWCRLNVDDERLPVSSEAFVYVAMILQQRQSKLAVTRSKVKEKSLKMTGVLSLENKVSAPATTY